MNENGRNLEVAKKFMDSLRSKGLDIPGSEDCSFKKNSPARYLKVLWKRFHTDSNVWWMAI